MEEILASIRRIISEDDTEDAAAKQPAPATPPSNGAAPAVAQNVSVPPAATPATTDPHQQPTVRLPDDPKPAARSAAGENANGALNRFDGQGAETMSNADHAAAPADIAEEPALDLTEMVDADGRVVKIKPQGAPETPQQVEAAADSGPAAAANEDRVAVADVNQEQDELVLDQPVDHRPWTDIEDGFGAEPAAEDFGTSFGLAAQSGDEAVGTGDQPASHPASQDEDDGHPAVSFSDAGLAGTPAIVDADEAAPAVTTTQSDVLDLEPAPAVQAPADEYAPAPDVPEADHGNAFAELAGTAEPEDSATSSADESDDAPVGDPSVAQGQGTVDSDTEATSNEEPVQTEATPAAAAVVSGTIQETGNQTMSDVQASDHNTGELNGAAAGGDAGAVGLEAMVRKMAEPMVQQWIDQNMPRLVEDIVQREVARRLSGG